MDVEQLNQDVREGRVDVDRLAELMATLQRQLTERGGAELQERTA